VKVLHVATLFSPDAAYGGPIRVALNQATALAAAGHQVTVAGSHRGYAVAPTQQDGVPLQLFAALRLVPRTGFAGLSSPGLLRWAATHLRGFDVVHVHLARDLVTLPVAALALALGVPLVLQTHGMVDRSARRSAGLLDALLVRRVLRGARHVLYLNPTEHDELRAVAGPRPRLTHLPNGVPDTALRARGDSREVLYLARLAPRKRPLDFVRAAVEVHATQPDLRFTMVGPDEGELPAVQELIAAHDAGAYVRYEGPLGAEAVLERLTAAALYVLPAVDEPAPMSVLEAMSVGLPVVVTDTCGLAPAIKETGAGLVTDGSVDQLVAAVRSCFDGSGTRERLAERALVAARDTFGMTPVARRLAELYR